MLEGLIGKKLGMTQIFDAQGNVVPVTVLQAGPCVVVQRKTVAGEGYDAVQLGLVEARKLQANKPQEGHFSKAGVPATRRLKEFSLQQGADLEVGAQVLVSEIFRENEKVDVSGTTIGKGFQGVIKRHGHSGGRATHGSMFHRAPGSIGQSAYPSRVMRGMKLPGRMGGKQVKKRNLRVVRIDEENNLLLVKGSVPGSRGNYVYITRSNRA